MESIIDEFEILISEVKQRCNVWVESHLRERKRLLGQLLLNLLDMIQVYMGVAKRMHEIAWLITGDLGKHHCKERIGGNIEGQAKEDIGATLVKLAGKPAVSHMELK